MSGVFRPPHDVECPVCRADAWGQEGRGRAWLDALGGLLIGVFGVVLFCVALEAGWRLGHWLAQGGV